MALYNSEISKLLEKSHKFGCSLRTVTSWHLLGLGRLKI